VGANITMPSVVIFSSGFYTGLDKLCHKCVTGIWKRLKTDVYIYISLCV